MTQFDTHRPNILIVDDTPHNLRVLTFMLTRKGYQVYPALNGKVALKTIQTMLPDLILLDIMLDPGMNGYEVCQQLKADERTRDIPVLFMSALDATIDKTTAFQVGGVDYITKPFQTEEVLARVETHLALRNMQKQLQEQNAQLKTEIAERKQVEEALKESVEYIGQIKKEWESTADSLSYVVCLLDNQGRIIRANRTVEHWNLGRVIDIPGREMHELFHPDCSDPACYFKLFLTQAWEEVTQGRSVECEAEDTILQRYLSIQLRPILAQADGSRKHISSFAVGSVNDITVQKQAEKTLKSLNQQLKEANASKDRFFSIIAHDLRSPFTGLLGFTQTITENIESYTTDEIQEAIHTLRTSTETVYALLENLLSWARLQQGLMPYKPQKIFLKEIVEDNLYLFDSNAKQKQITLRNAAQEEATAYADHKMIDTVIRNLLSNALKFTPSGGTVTVSAKHIGEYVEVVVSDTGIGMSEEELAQLFRIDVKFTNVGTAGETGTGLGLHLCEDLLEKNGGRLWVNSEVGKGTTFQFTLPAMPVE